jgi:hypothetical protein
VALAEKAYAQANESGYVGTSNPRSNSYQALNGGWPSWALSALSCLPTASTGGFTASGLAAAWQAGKMIVLDTPYMGNSPQSINGVNIVSTHSYAVVGYNPLFQLFTLFNPWGTGGGFEKLPNGTFVFCGGTVTGTGSQLAAVFTTADQTGSAAAGFADGRATAATAGGWARDALEESHGGSKSIGLPPVSLAAGRNQVQDRSERLAVGFAPLSEAVPSGMVPGAIASADDKGGARHRTQTSQDLADLLFTPGGRAFGWDSLPSRYLLPD